MAREDSLAKRLTNEGVGFLLVEGVKWVAIWLAPWVLAAITFISRYFEVPRVPLALAIPSAAFVFAATATGLLRYDEWRYRRSPRDKLIFSNASLGLDYVRDETTGRVIGISQAQVVISLQNLATFPISYVIKEIQSSLEGRINPRPTYRTYRAIVGPMSTVVYRDDLIDMQGFQPKPILQRTLQFKLKYGHKGWEKQEISKRVNISASLDPVSGTYPLSNFQDVLE